MILGECGIIKVDEETYQSELEKWEEGLSKSQISAINRAYHKYTVSNFKGDDLDAMLRSLQK